MIGGLAVAGASWAQSAGERLPQFPKGSSFKSAHAELIRAGFSPIPQNHPNPHYYCGSFDGEPDLCVVYPEVIDCTAVGIQYCSFAFERKTDHKHLVVTTYGEQVARLMIFKTEWRAFR